MKRYIYLMLSKDRQEEALEKQEVLEKREVLEKQDALEELEVLEKKVALEELDEQEEILEDRKRELKQEGYRVVTFLSGKQSFTMGLTALLNCLVEQ